MQFSNHLIVESNVNVAISCGRDAALIQWPLATWDDLNLIKIINIK